MKATMRYGRRRVHLALLVAAMVSSVLEAPRPAWAREPARLRYIQSNHRLEGRNAIVAYERLADGTVKPPPPAARFSPAANDTPIVVSLDILFDARCVTCRARGFRRWGVGPVSLSSAVD